MPLQVINTLVDIFIEKIRPQYPFYDEETLNSFRQSVIHPGAEDSEEPRAKVSHFAVSMMMAISVMTSRTTDLVKQSVLAESLYRDALLYYDRLGPSTLTKLQCTMLLVLYSIFRPGDVNIWNVKSLAMRLAVAMGLHRETCGVDDAFDDSTADLRRRIFWTLYYWDRAISISSHRPLGIADNHIDVSLPCVPAGDRVTARFVRSLTLRQIQSEVYSVNFFGKSLGDTPYETWVEATEQRLSSWADEVTSLGDHGFDFFEFIISTVLLHLHRPSQARPVLGENAVLACFDAAASILQGYWRMIVRGFLKYDWHMAHQAFEAGIVVLYVLRHYKTVLESHRTTATILEVVNGFTNVFMLLSRRWPASINVEETYERIKIKVLKQFLAGRSSEAARLENDELDRLVRWDAHPCMYTASEEEKIHQGAFSFQSHSQEHDLGFLSSTQNPQLLGVPATSLNSTLTIHVFDPLRTNPVVANQDFTEMADFCDIDWNTARLEAFTDPSFLHWAM
ncbi:hypothetical protein A1O1_05692 [Capronia coronata CBS 617.96]|uniref:Xylanolytic transcriptional activator regulatory domain-containing protein n=1 Tax=Capronia coronata CBS 617.96 TaxID=1182541 RepID=W9XYM8_9EURO|nr:uncharacterized protein A1O1_05692 [Capronia coronata CBS 617.96]EXJ85328.1 hypothetical protein A1O1_05692 [Capronia coronata CBS 617.96]